MTVITAAGTPADLGHAHGRMAASAIRSGLAAWRADFTDRGKDADALIEALSHDAEFRAAVRHHLPDLATEVDAIAAGSGCTPEEIFAINCLDEAWWWDESGAGCSVLAAAGSTTSPGVAGQNMDLDTWMDRTQVVLRLAPESGPRQVLLSRAGLVGLCGVNDRGLVVLVNTLDQLPEDPAGVPVAFVLRALTGCLNLAQAVDLLHELPHASGQAYTLASPDGVRGFECGAGVVREYVNDDSRPNLRWHTNHPLAYSPEGSGTGGPATGSSQPRYDHASKVAQGDVDAATVEELLTDTESGICMFPGRWRDDGFTFGSIIASLSVPPRVRIALGPPDRVPYEVVDFPSN